MRSDEMTNWTKKKPNEAGWYWYKINAPISEEIAYIYKTARSGELIAMLIGDITKDVDDIDGWWAKAEPPEWDGE